MERIDNVVLDGVGAAIINDVGIIADLHIGMEEMLNIRVQTRKMLDNVDYLVNKYKLKSILINGDLKHGFDKSRRQEWEEIRYLLKEIKKKVNVFIVKGNHDFYIENIIKEKTYDYMDINGIRITHGHKLIDYNRMLIIGNEHPVIKIRDDVGAFMTYRCFVYFKDKKILVLPAFNPLSKGNNIFNNSFISPVLKNTDIKKALIYAIEEKDIFFLGNANNILLNI